MALSTDLKILEQYSPAAVVSNSPLAPSTSSSFSQVFSAACQVEGGSNYDKYFQLAAETYQIPANLIKALAKAESDFDPKSVSRCGAQGIMQLMPGTARSLGVTDAFDPAQNIMGGAKYLRQMLDTFDGDVETALAAYNAGPGAIKNYGGMMPSQRNYINKILKYAGGDISYVSPSSGEVSREIKPVSDDSSLTPDNLADLIYQAYSTGNTYNQEAVRFLLLQLFLKNAKENEGQELNVSL